MIKRFIGESTDVVKSGVFSIVDGILTKVIITISIIAIILSAGCVATNVAIDVLTK